MNVEFSQVKSMIESAFASRPHMKPFKSDDAYEFSTPEDDVYMTIAVKYSDTHDYWREYGIKDNGENAEIVVEILDDAFSNQLVFAFVTQDEAILFEEALIENHQIPLPKVRRRIRTHVYIKGIAGGFPAADEPDDCYLIATKQEMVLGLDGSWYRQITHKIDIPTTWTRYELTNSPESIVVQAFKESENRYLIIARKHGDIHNIDYVWASSLQPKAAGPAFDNYIPRLVWEEYWA